MIDRHVILIIDDTPENLHVLGNMLEQEGHEVLVATSGMLALQIARATPPPDLILLDIMMPEMDGYEVCRRLKGELATRTIPVIFISALGQAEQKLQAFREGGVDYITKPFQSTEVVARVHAHLQLTQIATLKQEIGERKRAEAENASLQKQLVQAQKMEAIGTLAGGIAHDFNNILGAIVGYAGLAKAEADPNSQIARDLSQVLNAADRAKNLVQQILAFSRQGNVDRIPLRITPLVKESLKMLRAAIPSTIAIREEIDSRCGTVLADPTQIQQIVMNLCTNAFHAMEKEGGVLAVAVARYVADLGFCFEGRMLPAGEYVCLTVGDTGGGIDPECMERIFDPYFTTKELGKGTGLGLSITHGIVKSHGGAITVESIHGQGATFRVYLPTIQLEVMAGEAGQEAPGGQERILFVDDEEVLLEMGRELLTRLGYTVTAYRNGGEALATFTKAPEQFDLVFADLTMPGMSGIELARHMLSLRPELPFILCTGFGNPEAEEEAKAVGIREFAMKPLTRAAIAKLVRKLLDSGATREKD